MFRTGQKVICIKKMHQESAPCGMTAPVYLGVYTIRSKMYCEVRKISGVRLYEIMNPLHPNGEEYGYEATSFTPVDDRETDISSLKQILIGENV